MAVNQGLNVQLSADASQFISTLQAALAQAQAAGSGMADAASSMSSLTSAANAATAAANALSNSLASATQSGNTAGSSAQNLASTLSFVNRGTSQVTASIQGFNHNLLGTSPTMRAFITDAQNGRISFVGLGGALTNAGNAVTGMDRLIRSVSATMVGLNRNVSANSAVMRGFINSAQLGQLSYVGLNGALTNAGRAIQNIRRPAAAGGAALTDFSRIAQDLPFGFIAIQNNIPPLIESLGRLSAANGGAAGALRALGGALVGPAGIAFAVSAITSLLTVTIQKYGGLGKAISEIFGTVSDATRAFRAHADAIKGASNEYAKAYAQISTLKNNLELAKKGFIDKTGVVKQYNETIGKTTSAVKTLDEVEQGLAKNADAYIKFTLLKAAAQVALQKAAEQALAAQEVRSKPSEDVVPYIFSGLKGKGKDAEKLYEKAATAEREKIAKENDKTQALFEKIAKEFQDQAADLAKKYKFNFFAGDIKDKKVKTTEDVLKSLDKELSNIDYQAQLTGASFDSISKDKVTALQKAFEELVKLGLTPASPVLKNIADQINHIGAATIGTEKIGKRLQEVGKAFIIRKIDPGGLQNLDKYQNEFNKRYQDTRDRMQSKIDNTTITWGKITEPLGAATIDLKEQFSGLANATAYGIGNVIASIVSGGDSLGASLYKLVGVMGQFIADFGKALIAAATLKIIAEKSLLANPYVALAAGIGAVALGEVLRNKTPSFATGGGIIGGPQLAMVGDNPGREEYVIPSEVLDRLGGGGARVVRVVGVLRGQDIAFANQRATRAKARIN
ncbi:hypothetical protein SAMN04488128_103168 [Chitinophaga eiseniae]|uniref:Prophage tail length tape measure protein n=1 Tax=Chitinophaga eiseniae TaxID=634771 RepID=A0A1T4SNH1_9BACT|nr:hypothetical protein [Chitinophaga eiseniae]SKA29752.1 hypothetical protein SAMN04488128_103168 [Chitinophaga eiseniae]